MISGKNTKHTCICTTHEVSACLQYVWFYLWIFLYLCLFPWYTDNQRNWVASLLSVLKATDNNIKPEDWDRNVLTCSKDKMKGNDISVQADSGGGKVWNVADDRIWRTKIIVRSWDLNLTQGYRSQQEFNKIRFTFFFFLKFSLLQVWWALNRGQEWRL